MNLQGDCPSCVISLRPHSLVLELGWSAQLGLWLYQGRGAEGARSQETVRAGTRLTR